MSTANAQSVESTDWAFAVKRSSASVMDDSPPNAAATNGGLVPSVPRPELTGPKKSWPPLG